MYTIEYCLYAVKLKNNKNGKLRHYINIMKERWIPVFTGMTDKQFCFLKVTGMTDKQFCFLKVTGMTDKKSL